MSPRQFRAWRHFRGMTQQQVADAVSQPRQYVNGYEMEGTAPHDLVLALTELVARDGECRLQKNGRLVLPE